MRLLRISELMAPGQPMMTPLYMSDITKTFAVRLEAGQEKNCGCTCQPEAFFQVVEGKGTIYLDEEAYPVEAGEMIMCPAGVRHRLTADLDSVFGLIVVRPLKQ